MDTISAIIFVAGPIALGVMGVAMSVWPPERVGVRDWKISHWAWIAGFVLVAILTFLAGIEQWHSTETSQDELNKNVKELKVAVEALTKPLPKDTDRSRDPDAIYQNGAVVGKVIAPRIALNQSKIYFEQLQNAGKLDQSKPFEYRDFELKIGKVDSYIEMLVSSASGVATNVYQHVVCDIVGNSSAH